MKSSAILGRSVLLASSTLFRIRWSRSRSGQDRGHALQVGIGTGTNLSPLRSSFEQLAGRGVASGPVLHAGYDAFAASSSQAVRLAGRQDGHSQCQPSRHEEFILCKGKEEAKAHALMSCGYDGTSGPESEAYLSISFQNANNSVRVTDEFMEQASIHLSGIVLLQAGI